MVAPIENILSLDNLYFVDAGIRAFMAKAWINILRNRQTYTKSKMKCRRIFQVMLVLKELPLQDEMSEDEHDDDGKYDSETEVEK